MCNSICEVEKTGLTTTVRAKVTQGLPEGERIAVHFRTPDQSIYFYSASFEYFSRADSTCFYRLLFTLSSKTGSFKDSLSYAIDEICKALSAHDSFNEQTRINANDILSDLSHQLADVVDTARTSDEIQELNLDATRLDKYAKSACVG